MRWWKFCELAGGIGEMRFEYRLNVTWRFAFMEEEWGELWVSNVFL